MIFSFCYQLHEFILTAFLIFPHLITTAFYDIQSSELFWQDNPIQSTKKVFSREHLLGNSIYGSTQGFQYVFEQLGIRIWFFLHSIISITIQQHFELASFHHFKSELPVIAQNKAFLMFRTMTKLSMILLLIWSKQVIMYFCLLFRKKETWNSN